LARPRTAMISRDTAASLACAVPAGRTSLN
jgi:hypothetical protein